MHKSRILRFAMLLSLALLADSVTYTEARSELYFGPLSEKEREAYGNRADFFVRMPEWYRPDLDWRTALAPDLADEDPEWSQGFEELVIRDFLGDRRGGFFVDVGCYKPTAGSTTYYLEHRLGWKGIGIDAMERYRASWEKVRPTSTFVHAAISDKDGEILDLHVAYNIVSIESDVIEQFGLSDRAKTIQVETSTLDTILEQQGVERIDFMSIDIEGAELAALRGLDLKRFKPGFLGIETTKPDAVIAHLEASGYEVIGKYRKVDKINLYFRPKTAH